MFIVRLAGGYLYGKWLFTWLSLVMSLMVSYFVLSFSHEMSWMRSGTEFIQFLRIFPHTLLNLLTRFSNGKLIIKKMYFGGRAGVNNWFPEHNSETV